MNALWTSVLLVTALVLTAACGSNQNPTQGDAEPPSTARVSGEVPTSPATVSTTTPPTTSTTGAPSTSTVPNTEPRGTMPVPSRVPNVDVAEPIRIAYGDDPLQFGDLYLPATGPTAAGPQTVVVLIHGGFWRNPFRLDLMEPLAEDLQARGFAVWNVEYRSVGDDGGGYPGTFEDVGAAMDALLAVDADQPGVMNLDRVAVVGHSAGGHLALWAASRDQLPPEAPGASPEIFPAVAIGQAPVADIQTALDVGLGGGAAAELLGGSPTAEVDPEVVRWATPQPSGAQTVVVVGTNDFIVRPRFSEIEGAVIARIDDADHFDLIDPEHPAWEAVLRHLPR